MLLFCHTVHFLANPPGVAPAAGTAQAVELLSGEAGFLNFIAQKCGVYISPAMSRKIYQDTGPVGVG